MQHVNSLVFGMWDLLIVLPPEIEPGPPVVGAWSLSCWTPMEVL